MVRDLYACAADRWVHERRTVQHVLVPAHDAGTVDAWFRLGFGLQHVHAAREPGPATGGGVEGEGSRSSRVTVRRAVRADIPLLGRLDVLLP